MSRGYGRSYRKGFSHASIQFDKLYKENSNKPSAARSAGTVGKWGITSFTSIRSSNGFSGSQYTELSTKRPKLDDGDQNTNRDPFSFEQGLSDKNSSNIQPVKPKKFFKSRNTQPLDDVQCDQKICTTKLELKFGSSSKKAKASYGSVNKFFQSKRSPSPTPAAAVSPSAPLPKRDESKPPIVLRICRGKSRLLSDSDESESTPTPSSVPSSSTVTSPRSARDTHTTRITRSARRSMQQELGSSPATAETPTDTFASLLSPEYIPPEKFELERKAMYDNLLGPSSPLPDTTSILSNKTDTNKPTQFIEEEEEEEDDELEPEPEPEQEQEQEQEHVTNKNLQHDSQESAYFSQTSTNDQSIIDSQQQQQQQQSNSQTYVDSKCDRNLQDTGSGNDTNTIISRNISDTYNTYERNKEATDDYALDVGVSITENKGSDVVMDSSSESDSESSQSAALNNTVVVSKTIHTNVLTSNSNITTTTITTTNTIHTPTITTTTTSTITNSTTNSIEQHRDEIIEKILEKPVEVPPVKLVISKKKGSIFKSRSMVTDGSKKRRALYRHKWCDDKDTSAQKGSHETMTDKKESSTDSSHFNEYSFQNAPLTRVTHSAPSEYQLDGSDTITSVKCPKNDKEFYTVVRNVKKAHQIQEIGEFQEFNDDVEYILDALQDNNPTGTRCLSAISLATKCMVPAFRMHVRAHGLVAKFFKALHDATKDQSLGLCTATVMFVLSQDRLNMDLDRDCLELMLNLLESDVSYQKALDECGLSSAQLHKNKLKVRELCAEIQSQGHAMHLNLDNITVGQLAMETLLSLTSKRAGEWFKEELRELGGLQHIMETICECCRQVSDYVVVWTDTLLDKLRKVDRCMRVLENVTQNNEQNQTYLLQYNNGLILDTLVKLYRLCDAEIPLYPVTDIADKESTGSVIREALLVTLKVLINLTHHFSKKSMGSTLIGSKPGIVDASLHLLLQIPHYIPEQKKFELGVLVLMLLINLIQDNDDNKKLLIDAKAPADFESIFPCDKSALEALITQFYNCEELARVAEKRTNAILDGEKDHNEIQSQPKSHEEFIEETVAKLLQKAGTHMEYTFLASYIVMLLGFLIMDNPDYEGKVRHFLRGHTFTDMVEILKKFFSFMNLTASTDASNVCQIKATEKVIKYMEECDRKDLNSEGDSSVNLDITMS